MPIPLPNLDDRTFADLVSETRALIPRYAPRWTDHNPSDPGITLIELFAWLTEMLIYRLDRIPEASEARFVELLGAVFQPAQPATVRLNVTASNLGTTSVIIPRGTRLAAQLSGRTAPVPFETLSEVQLSPGAPSAMVEARQTSLLAAQPLGVSRGKSHQVISLTRGHYPFFEAVPLSPLNPAGGPGGPASTGTGTPSAPSNGSSTTLPAFLQVTVGPDEWTYQSSLLQSTSSDRHFTVDVRLNALRFGDGHRGQIPQEGAPVIATYLGTLGREGNVTSSSTFNLDLTSAALPPQITQALEQGVSFSWSMVGTVQPGANPTTLEEARKEAITTLKTRWRGVTAADFQELTLQMTQFNLARAICLPELDLTSSEPYASAPGHVSVIIVPQSNEEMPAPDQGTIDGVWAELDQSRLITCRHHVVGPEYTGLRIAARLVRSPQVQGDRLRSDIQQNLRAFFHPLSGGPEGEGWPFGRDVYASEAYQVIEGTSGVDHVEALRIYTREPSGDWTDVGDRLEVPSNSLVHFVAQDADLQIWAER